MYSFGTMKSQTPQVGSARQTSQVAHHLSQGSSAVWSANTMQQCMVNSGVHGLHGTNFTLQNGTSQSRHMTSLQNPDPTSYKGNSEVQVSQSTNLAFQNEANHSRQTNRLQSSDPSHYMGNSGVQPSQSTNFALQKGANNNRQMKSLQSSDTPQYMGNSGVQVSRSSYFTSQNGGNDSRPIMSLQSSDSSDIPSQFKEASQQIDHILLKLILSQPQYTVNKFQDGSVSVPTTCIPGSATMQNPLLYNSNQSLHSPVDTKATYRNHNTANFCNRPVYFEAEMNRTRNASLLEQNRAQQAMHGTPNGEMTKAISSYTSTILNAYEEMVNTNIPGSAAISNNQAQVGPTQIHRQSFSEGGYSQNVSPSCQSFGNNSVGTQRMSSNPQGISVSNMSKISRQPSNRCSPSYNNCGGFRSINSLNQCEMKSFQSKRIKRSLSHDTTTQQMPRQNMHAESTNRLYASKPNPPPYWSHVFPSPTTNKNVQTKNVAPSEMYSLNASKSLPLHSRLPVPQSVMPTNQQNGNAQFQHNALPNAMISSNERNNSEGGQVIPSNVVPECDRVIWQRKDVPAMVVSHSNNSGMLSPFKQNDSCASSMSGHPGTKAIAVVPPLSQEEYHSPTSSETCKSVDDAQKSCISTDLPTINETTFGRGEPNQNQVTPKKANANEALLTISDSETESLAEKLIQNDNEPIVQRVSEVSVSVTSSGEHTEGTRLPNFNELSLLPAKSWTAEALTKLILEMDEAQPKPINNLKYSSIIKIMMMPWNKNVDVITNYNIDCQKCLLSEVEEFCETHIKQETVVLKQVTPDFQDQLKRYIVLKDDEMPSEPPYKSLWLNINDQLDDIDKDFGFPLALKRHIVVEETESQGHNFEVIDNIPEQTVDEAVNKGLYPAKSESVGMDKESQISQSPPASPQESSDKSFGESSYSFKIEVLPPEEAKLIFEQVNPKNQKSSSCEKETVTGSGKRKGIEDMGHTLHNLKVKKSSDNQLKEICCLTRFVEINAGVKLSSKCKCGSKQNANESTTNTLKLDPDFCQQDVNFPLSNIKPSSHLSHIIDLTDDDDQLLSLFDNEPEPIVQTCSPSNAVVCDQKDKEISSEFSLQDLQSFVIKKRETGIEHVQDVLKEPVQSSNSASCTQLSTEDSDYTRTKEPHLLSNQEKEEDAPVTSHGNVRSPSENQTNLEVSNVDKRMLNISVCKAPDDKTKGKRQKKKRQRSLEHYFHSLKKPKICRLPVASDSNSTSEAQNSFYKEKTLALVLFGQQEASSSKKDKCLVSSPITASYEKHKPPGVLSVKLDSSRRDITTANTTKDCSVKQKIYEKWRRSVPTMNSSVATQSKKKMRRRHSLPASLTIERTEEKKTVSPELRLSDRTRKYILSLKKRRALTECRRREEIKRSYSVTIETPEHQQGREMDEEGDGMVNRDGIVLKFSVLPNTFNFTAGSSEREEAESISDSLKPVEKVYQEPAKKLKVRTWYSSEAMQYRPLCVPKNPGLFDEYRKKYKEKTLTSTDE